MELLPVILALVPLNQWESLTGEGSILAREQQLYETLEQGAGRLVDCYEITTDWQGMQLKEEEIEVEQMARRIRDQADLVVIHRSDRLLISAFGKLAARLEQTQRLAGEVSGDRLSYYQQYKEMEALCEKGRLRAEVWSGEEGGGDYYEISDRMADLLVALEIQLSKVGPSEELFEKAKERLESLLATFNQGKGILSE